MEINLSIDDTLIESITDSMDYTGRAITDDKGVITQTRAEYLEAQLVAYLKRLARQDIVHKAEITARESVKDTVSDTAIVVVKGK